MATAVVVLCRVWGRVWVGGTGVASVARVGGNEGSGVWGGQEETQERALRSTAIQGRTRGRDTVMRARERLF